MQAKEMVRALLLAGKLKMKVEVHQVPPYTFCRVVLKTYDKKHKKLNIEGVGFSKHNLEDRKHSLWGWDSETGVAIAYVRAVEMVVGKLEILGVTFIEKWKELG